MESDEINARISVDGTVTFVDSTPVISKTDIEKALAQAQEQSKLLFDIERTMNASKDYLTKVRLILCLLEPICGGILNVTIHRRSNQRTRTGAPRTRISTLHMAVLLTTSTPDAVVIQCPEVETCGCTSLANTVLSKG